MKPTLYTLDVIDSDDDFLYTRLVFDTIDDMYNAMREIEEFDKKWYNDEIEDEYNAGYYEVLISRLEHLIQYKIYNYEIKIR